MPRATFYLHNEDWKKRCVDEEGGNVDTRIKRGAPVSFWNYMATVEQYAQCALIFGRVLGVGKMWVTVRTEFGHRTRRRVNEMGLSYAPEGEEILQKHGV